MFTFLRRLLRHPNPLNQPTIPIDEKGWIACSDAQPQVGRAVRIRLLKPDRTFHEAFGIRTQDIDPKSRQEVWSVSPGPGSEPLPEKAAITHWKTWNPTA